MENSHASPGLLKQANSSALHRVLREKGAATRAQLAAATGVSVTTVRALLEEMLEKGSVMLLSDVGCGALLCRAAMESAALNVFVNTAALNVSLRICK